MPQQNVFDNETFFDGYRQIRDNKSNANVLFEMPVLFSMLPDLNEKSVLDLGCGFGEHCMEYVRRGAKKVTGIDISERMLDIARTENSDPKITYIKMAMEDIDELADTYDVVISSLAFHYVEDFFGVLRKIYNLLTHGGLLIFSQENPLCTCHGTGKRWTKNEAGNKLYLNLSNYGVEGERESRWFVDGVKKYHRMFSTIVNDLTESGFVIEKMSEPLPDKEISERYSEHNDLFHKPDFLIIRARKNKRNGFSGRGDAEWRKDKP